MKPGRSMVELARESGIAENTLYRWKSRFGRMEVSEAKRLREQEFENAKLKLLLAEAELDNGPQLISCAIFSGPNAGV